MDFPSRREFLQIAALSAGAVASTGLAACTQGRQQESSQQSQYSSSSKLAVSSDSPAFITSFVVMSDTHVAEELCRNNEHFTNALDDIRSFDPPPATIVINGDITDDAYEKSYALIHDLCNEHGFDFKTDFVKVMGNHDQYSPDFDPAKTGHDVQHLRFMEEVGVSSVYYDTFVDGNTSFA